MGVRGLRQPLLLSVLIHLSALLVWVFLLDHQATEGPRPTVTYLEVESVPKLPHEDEQKKKRIVQSESGKKVEKAKPDSFLGWQNQVVDRETVSSEKATVGAAPNRSRKTKDPSSQNLSKLGVPLLSPLSQAGEDQPEWATPGTRAQDVVPGVRKSDRTALNTQEYVFYSYYQRIRTRLDQAWVPLLRERLVTYYKTGRHLASDMDHTTRVLVILNGKGEIIKVKIQNGSGTRDLDEAAVGAFNSAGPFPNPPKGMVDLNNEIHVPWDFVLKT